MSTDSISVIEAAYATSGHDDAWIGRVVAAARPLVDDGFGAFGYRYELLESSVRVGTLVGAGAAPELLDAARMLSTFSSGLRDLHAKPRPELLSVRQLLGPGWTSQGKPAFETFGRPFGVRDAVAFAALDVGGRGVVLAAPTARPTRVVGFARRRWRFIAAHLTTALRLHALDSVADPDERLDAVLDPSGRALHVEKRAQAFRGELRDAVRAIDRARGPLRRRSPDEALQLWKALVAGEWSLVDRFERDGRRYVVARSNVPRPTHALAALTDRERAILALLAQGHTYKWIAYALGLNPWTVFKAFKRLRAKLGNPSRHDVLKLAGAAFGPSGVTTSVR